MKRIYKNIILVILLAIIGIAIHTNVQAAGIGMSASKSSAYVGDTFTVTISGINGRVVISGSSNISISPSGTQFVRGNLTVTATAKSTGTATVTVKPVDVSTTGANPVEVTTSASKSVTITQKPVQQTPQTTKPATTNKTTTTTKKTTTKKEETKKEPIEEVKEKEDASSEWGISSLKLVGVKENGEEVDLSLDKEFNINTYEYSCNVGNDIKTIKVFKEAYEYNDLVQISGLDEELKVGENEIVLKMAKEGKDTLSYKIKVIKEEPQEEVQETSSNIEEKEKLMVSMPVFWFVILEIAIIAVSVGATVVVMKYLRKK